MVDPTDASRRPTTATAAAPTAPTTYDLIRARLRDHGDRQAIVDGSTALSYNDLVDRVDSLALALRAAGTGPEQPVAVLVERSVHTVVAMLAVWAAGGAYCPLDTTMPAARTATILHSMGAQLAVADAGHAEKLPSVVTIIDPVGSVYAAAGNRAGPPAPPPHPDALAYVLYTSGSTGAPKGVAMTNRGLSRLVEWQVASGPPGLRTLQFTATGFDVIFQEVLSTLVTGGCLVVAPEHVRRDPAALLDTITQHRIQRLFLPYVALQLLAVTANRRSIHPTSLEHVITAGERLIITPAIRDMFAALPHCRLDNHYGPTETHLATSHTLTGAARTWPDLPSIGAAVTGVSGVVLDERLSPTPPDEIGELYLSGASLARGYQREPVQTAQRFVANPFAAGERMYRTGDLVRSHADGTFEFVGRTDTQMKVRGFRVEPVEVENALLRHPRVAAAAVGLRGVTDDISVLVGYLQTLEPVSHRDITDHLRGLLPAYMIPSRYLTVSTMPRTPTGKIDTRALATLDLPTDAEVVDSRDVEPAPTGATLIEVVTDIWQRVLGHDEFAIDDDFFEVGGDSLLATWVIAELSQKLGRQVDLSAFLDASTVAGLATAMDTMDSRPGRSDHATQIRTLRPGPSGRALYFAHPLGGELLAYRELCRASTAPLRLLGIGWTGKPPAFGSTLPEIASIHVEQLRSVEPVGPYWLAGWSFGGVLAFEMAQQLIASGSHVDFLGLFDANPVIDPITGLPLPETPYLGMLDAVMARLRDPTTTDADLTAVTSDQTWSQLMGSPIAPGSSSDYLRTVLDTARCCMSAAMRYRPQPYPGPVHLFQATGAGASHQDRLIAQMRKLCVGPLSILPIPGDHWTFIRGEHAVHAAAELDAALAKVGSTMRADHPNQTGRKAEETTDGP